MTGQRVRVTMLKMRRPQRAAGARAFVNLRLGSSRARVQVHNNVAGELSGRADDEYRVLFCAEVEFNNNVSFLALDTNSTMTW